jgi:hypothetical protein
MSKSRPDTWAGNTNSVIKDRKDVDLHVAFCFPDTYEIGMCTLACAFCMGLLNEMPGVWCERAFAPWDGHGWTGCAIGKSAVRAGKRRRS